MKILYNISNGIYASGADRVEKLRSEFRKECANAASGDDFRSVSLKMIGKLPHPVEVGLKTGQENNIELPFILENVERPVPVFMIERDFKYIRLYQGGYMQA